MRILFVAMANSIHTARWIQQIANQGWDIHLVPSIDNAPLHSYLQEIVTMHNPVEATASPIRRTLIRTLARWPHSRGSGHVRRLLERLRRNQAVSLDSLIAKLKPDIVHSMEFQHAAYRTLPSKLRMGNTFPSWIVSNWGSDLYHYGRLKEHKERIREVLAACDYYTCECERDVALARQFGFKGGVLPVVPVAGGLDIAEARKFRQPGPTSNRRVILLKGYQHWAGRALAGLRAIDLCADVLQGYRVVVQLASPDVESAAELMAHATGIPVELVPHVNHKEALSRFGSARIHLGLSISDGISQSLIESMAMGAFPIQSYTACANEWIEDGKSGFLVPPEDPHIIAEALRRALTDDALVDRAAKLNAETAQQRLAYAHVKEIVVGMYNSVFEASTRAQSA